jgi:hypothetical protein
MQQERIEALVEHKNFDRGIMLLIVASSVLLAIDNPLMDPASALVKALATTDVVLTVLFTLEMLMKIFVQGLWSGETTYLRSGWNVLDFVIVLISITSLVATNAPQSLQSLRALRGLRALRPLRMVSRNPGMKIVVNALLQSIPGVMNVFMVTSCFLLLHQTTTLTLEQKHTDLLLVLPHLRYHWCLIFQGKFLVVQWTSLGGDVTGAAAAHHRSDSVCNAGFEQFSLGVSQ